MIPISLVEVVSGLALSSIIAIVGLLWRLNVLMARQNGAIAHIMVELKEQREEMVQHRQDDREDFARVHQRIDRWTQAAGS